MWFMVWLEVVFSLILGMFSLILGVFIFFVGVFAWTGYLMPN